MPEYFSVRKCAKMAACGLCAVYAPFPPYESEPARLP